MSCAISHILPRPYYEHAGITIYHGDCLEIMPTLPAASVDLVLCDLPYGTTQNKWDRVLPLPALWAAYSRLSTPRTAFVFTAAQPFTTALIESHREWFRYALVWDKVGTTGFQTAKVRPLRRHEDLCVFYAKRSTYNPQMETRGQARHKGGSKTDNGCYGGLRSAPSFNNTYYPTSIVQVSNAAKVGLVHPTQKPVALMEYLIKTYTNPGDTVLDNCMGSGTTGVACVNTGRSFIGIEIEERYCEIAAKRLSQEVFDSQ